jgi:hypothetical protein
MDLVTADVGKEEDSNMMNEDGSAADGAMSI